MTTTPAPIVIRTRSTAAYALAVRYRDGAAKIVGYAYDATPRVHRRALRLGAVLVPIENGRVVVP